MVFDCGQPESGKGSAAGAVRVHPGPAGWLLAPQFAEKETAVTLEGGRFWAVLLAAAAFLFLVATVVGPPLLLALPVVAIAILAWLRRDLETAIGFHFWQDFVRFSFALLLNAAIWPR